MVATHNKIITMTEAVAEGVVHVEVGVAMDLLVQEVMKTLKNHHQVWSFPKFSSAKILYCTVASVRYG